MLKVHIQDRYSYCEGKAYLPAGVATDWNGESFTRYAPCQSWADCCWATRALSHACVHKPW